MRARCSFARVAACRRCLLEVLAGGACWCCLLELLAGAARCGLLGLLVGGAWRCFLLCCLLVRPAVAAAAVCGWDSRPDNDSVAFIYLSVTPSRRRSHWQPASWTARHCRLTPRRVPHHLFRHHRGITCPSTCVRISSGSRSHGDSVLVEEEAMGEPPLPKPQRLERAKAGFRGRAAVLRSRVLTCDRPPPMHPRD